MLEKKDPWNSQQQRAVAEIPQTTAVSDIPAETQWVIDIKSKLERAGADEDDGARSWPKVSIYRIPKRLRNNEENAYTPQMVSLGPYHHGEPALSGMERHKWRAVHQVLKRTGHRIERYLAAVKEMEADARACYEGPIEIGSDKFVEMLLLDSTFILEFFRGNSQGFEGLGYSCGDPIFSRCAGMASITRDMIMLENQIPLFVLNRIHTIQCSNGARASVASLALSFFEPLAPTDEASAGAALADKSGLHCLEVFRRSLLAVHEETKSTPSLHPGGQSQGKSRQATIHCVKELKKAGVKFEPKDTSKICDIDFNNGVLAIPRLRVKDCTKSLFLNLIAFEQCHRDCTNGITSYAIFMDYLINSPADVAYLHHCRIVDNYLGSNVEVAGLFNRLCHEVAFERHDSWLYELTGKINTYHDQPWNAWRASLTHKYFNNPWSIISFIAATVLLVLTFMQTYYTVYPYYAPRRSRSK